MHAPDSEFSDKRTLEQGAIIFFHDGMLESGKPFYLYIAIKGTYVKSYFELLGKMNPPSLDALKKLGTILAFGEGKPSAELKQSLHDKYGVEHS